MPSRLTIVFTALLTFGLFACTTSQPKLEPEPEPAISAEEELAIFLTDQQEDVVNTLRQNPHLSVTALDDYQILVQIRSGDSFRLADKRIGDGLMAAIQSVAGALLERATLEVMVIGHTDSAGTAENNQKLSEARAIMVREELIRHGLSPDRVLAEGRGATEPLVSNDTREGRAVNRRADFLIRVVP